MKAPDNGHKRYSRSSNRTYQTNRKKPVAPGSHYLPTYYPSIQRRSQGLEADTLTWTKCKRSRSMSFFFPPLVKSLSFFYVCTCTVAYIFFSQRHFPPFSPKCPIIISRSVADSLLPMELRIETLIICGVWCG